jgi:hypothetical protein
MARSRTGSILSPQDYRSRTRYRAPARWYGRLNRFGAWLVGVGLAPKGVMTLEVRRRVSGKLQRTPVLVTSWNGSDYIVSLAGESQWVRNVRAAGGAAALRRGRRHDAFLTEIPVSERPPIIVEYLRQGRERGGPTAGENQARFYFGLPPDPSESDIAAVADHYPVLRVEYRD